uniref:Uncharacterized protein n=1 Tax=Arundo donax TaxID=35708 RepID=A0A0A9AZ09_ARUDO
MPYFNFILHAVPLYVEPRDLDGHLTHIGGEHLPL